MKIIKVMSKKVRDKEYSKYIINIPKQNVEDSDLLNKELKIKSEKGKIIIEKE